MLRRKRLKAFMSIPIEAGALATSGPIGKCRKEQQFENPPPQSVPSGKCRGSLKISV